MTIVSFLLIFLCAALLIATLPLILELLFLTVAALLPSSSSEVNEESEAKSFRLAVIVPAHNEEAHIGRCVRTYSSPSGICRSAGGGPQLQRQHCPGSETRGARVLTLNDLSQTGKGAPALRLFSGADRTFRCGARHRCGLARHIEPDTRGEIGFVSARRRCSAAMRWKRRRQSANAADVFRVCRIECRARTRARPTRALCRNFRQRFRLAS